VAGLAGWRQSDIARQQEIETLAMVEAIGRYRQDFLEETGRFAASRAGRERGHRSALRPCDPDDQHDPGAAVKLRQP
jgi:hypothetical protein